MQASDWSCLASDWSSHTQLSFTCWSNLNFACRPVRKEVTFVCLQCLANGKLGTWLLGHARTFNNLYNPGDFTTL